MGVFPYVDCMCLVALIDWLGLGWTLLGISRTFCVCSALTGKLEQARDRGSWALHAGLPWQASWTWSGHRLGWLELE